MNNIEKKKKKVNKKVLGFVLVGIFALALVSAIAYYALFSVSFTVNQPIRVEGTLSPTFECIAGDTCLLEAITVSNDGIIQKTVVLSNDNNNPDVKVSYVGELKLTHKNLVTWVPTGADNKTITYTLVGNTFEFSGVPNNYSLVYYKDNIGYVYTGNVVTNIDMNLPVVGDENAVNDNVLDYCNNGFNTGATQCVGAKLWLVPTNAISVGNIINWGRANEFYFETELIQFNKEGNLVISPHSSITFRPQFEVDKYAINWTGTIKTTIA